MIKNEGILKVSRVGKVVNGEKRPIIVVLSSQEVKSAMFRNIKNVKDKLHWKGVSVATDFTKYETKLEEEMRKKVKQLSGKRGIKGTYKAPHGEDKS